MRSVEGCCTGDTSAGVASCTPGAIFLTFWEMGPSFGEGGCYVSIKVTSFDCEAVGTGIRVPCE